MEAAHEFDSPKPATTRAWLEAPSPASHCPSLSRSRQNGHRPCGLEGRTTRVVRRWWRRISLWLVGAASAASVQADQGWEGHSLHVNWENDATRGSDRHYTQGSRIIYWSADHTSPTWVQRASDKVPVLGFKAEALKF